MVKAEATVKNFAGIHVRPSGVIIQELKDYEGTIMVKGKGMEVNLNNIMSLIALGLEKGDTVSVEVHGPEEANELNKVKELLEREYDFPPRK